MRKLICGLLGFMIVASPAQAWNSVGHRTVAQVAWRNMSENERKAASDLLKQHPHYDQLLAVDVPKGVSTNEWAFMNAALWPDLIRPARAGDPPRPEFFTRYNVYPHAILLPVVRTSDARTISIKDFEVETPTAETGITNSIAVLRNKKASTHDRAVALTWLLHLCADIHQPLHASTLITPKKPKGNGAGGVFALQDPKGREVRLHAWWDAIPVRDGSYEGISAFADELMTTPELRRNRLPQYRKNKTVLSWAMEGHKHAADFAYAEEHVNFVLGSDVDSGKIARADVPRMSEQYYAEAERLARERLALASLRLSDLMKDLF